MAKGGADSAAVADVLLQRYNSYEGPRPLGNMWSVTRGAMTLRCALPTHVVGWNCA